MIRNRTWLLAGVLLVVGLCASAPAFAQTTLNSTTLAADLTATQQIIPLTAVTNITASSRNLDGDYIFVGGEAMQVNAIDTTAKTVTVRRGVAGTGTYAHTSGGFVWTGPKQRFYLNHVSGKCTATSEQYLPHIVLPGQPSALGAAVFDCLNSAWVKIRDYGGQRYGAGLSDTSSTTSGTVQSTEYVLNSVSLNATDFAASSGVRCVAWGTGAANANAKNLKFYFGATSVVTLTGTTDSGKDYLAEIVVLRSGASTQAGYGSITSDIGAPDAFAVTTALAESETAAITIAVKSANTAAAAASATGKGLFCTILP